MENGYVESFDGKLRDELLNGELFNTLREAQVLIERWRRHYNEERPHAAFGYRTPAPGRRYNWPGRKSAHEQARLRWPTNNPIRTTRLGLASLFFRSFPAGRLFS